MEKKQFINCSGKLIDISEPIVMGILNVTPDSFYDGGKNNTLVNALKKTEKIIEEGGKIVDIGAFSTRPNSQIITHEQERNRLFPILEVVKKEFPNQIISIDTFRAKIAKEAVLSFGVDIINDISSGMFDNQMFDVVTDLNVPYIMMHLQGNLDTMHNSYFYLNIVHDIILFFSEKISLLRIRGVNDIILDPGFGFSKNLIQNYELLKNLKQFDIFEELLLVGISRKSMIYKALDIESKGALNGTTVLNTLALQAGANILRVHDVKEAVETIELLKYLK